jgi:hypothetical protein
MEPEVSTLLGMMCKKIYALLGLSARFREEGAYIA